MAALEELGSERALSIARVQARLREIRHLTSVLLDDIHRLEERMASLKEGESSETLRWKQQRIRQIRAMREAGVGWAICGRAFGVSGGEIKRVLQADVNEAS